MGSKLSSLKDEIPKHTCGCVLSHFSRVQLYVTPWTVACQAPLAMGFSRQEYWSGLPFPFSGDILDPGIQPVPAAWQTSSLTLSYVESPVLNIVLWTWIYTYW